MKFIITLIHLLLVVSAYSCNKCVHPQIKSNQDSIVNQAIDKTLKQLIDNRYIN